MSNTSRRKAVPIAAAWSRLEGALEEAVRRALVEDYDRPVDPLGGRCRDHLERPLEGLGAADDDEIRVLLDLAAGASGLGQRHRADRRSGGQRLPNRVQAQAALECRVDVEAAVVHGRPPTERRT